MRPYRVSNAVLEEGGVGRARLVGHEQAVPYKRRGGAQRDLEPELAAARR